jgi:hypothetical protein
MFARGLHLSLSKPCVTLRRFLAVYGEELSAPRPSQTLEGHPFSAASATYLVYSQLHYTPQCRAVVWQLLIILYIVTWGLKEKIVEPEETAVARKRLVNTFLPQRIHERKNRGIVGDCVFYAFSRKWVLASDSPDLSSEGAPDIDKRVTVKQ